MRLLICNTICGIATLFVAHLLFARVVSQHQHRVAAIEINQVYNGEGDLRLRQAILWADYQDGEHVVAWRMLKPTETAVPAGDGWSLDWNGRPGAVWSAVLRRTWTQYDPEILDRKHLPQCERIGVRD